MEFYSDYLIDTRNMNSRDVEILQLVNWIMVFANVGLFILNLCFDDLSVNKYKKAYLDTIDKLDTLEKKNEKDVEDYNKLVDQYNELLDENEKNIQDYNKLVDDNSALQVKNEKDVEDYNKLLDDYNKLMEQIEAKNNRISRLESRLDRMVNYKE